ncbi:MAG TPA: hypothetical protein VII87_08875 [Solirubrobacteraceae bacterium]
MIEHGNPEQRPERRLSHEALLYRGPEALATEIAVVVAAAWTASEPDAFAGRRPAGPAFAAHGAG